MVFAGCSWDAPRIGEIIDSARRKVGSSAVDIAGIRLQQTEEEVQSRLNGVACAPKGNGIDVCTWRSTEEDRHHEFKGIDRLKLTFYGNRLQMIEVQYYEMFDVEYGLFEKGVRNKYGYAIAGFLLDSTGTTWEYDSVKVMLNPHRKQHWTGTMFVYVPDLTFQDRSLYGKWLNEVEQQRPHTLY